jgi:hypothetical protein
MDEEHTIHKVAASQKRSPDPDTLPVHDVKAVYLSVGDRRLEKSVN